MLINPIGKRFTTINVNLNNVNDMIGVEGVSTPLCLI